MLTFFVGASVRASMSWPVNLCKQFVHKSCRFWLCREVDLNFYCEFTQHARLIKSHSVWLAYNFHFSKSLILLSAKKERKKKKKGSNSPTECLCWPVGRLAVEEEEQEGEECMATAGSAVAGRPVVRGRVPEGRGWPLFNSCLCSCWRKRGGTSLGG